MAGVIWQMVWPVVLYGLMVDGMSVLWGGPGTLAGTAAGAVLAVPVFWRLYGKLEGNGGEKKPCFGLRDGIICAVFGIAAGAAVNTLIMASPLWRYFPGFSHTAGNIYKAPALLRLGTAGIVIPAAEELVFRGLVFGGLRRKWSFGPAASLSAAVFGLYHGNALQGIYGFLMGWALAWEMERRQTVKGAVFMHMGANWASLVLTALTANWPGR